MVNVPINIIVEKKIFPEGMGNQVFRTLYSFFFILSDPEIVDVFKMVDEPVVGVLFFAGTII